MSHSQYLAGGFSKLQFHYWFSDKSHTMDALVHNKCERELLELTKAVAKLCEVNIKMETEPSGKGGIKSWLTVLAKSPKKTPPTKVNLVQILSAASIITPHHKSIEASVNLLLNHVAENAVDELSGLERLQQEQALLKAAIAGRLTLLDQDGVIKKRRSNFYDLLRRYQKVKRFSVALTDASKKQITEEQVITREDFKSFIVGSNTVPPQIVEHAQIEIVSPVLTKGNHKWRGVYQGAMISFAMKSDDFMTLVQSGKVEFKSGSSISCTLQIEKKVNAIGVERIIGYHILGVSSYSENGHTIETPEAKQKQKQTVASKRQLDLFG